MEDKGRLKGCMKFALAGGASTGSLVGVEKSSISLFKTMPVDGERSLAPNP